MAVSRRVVACVNSVDGRRAGRNKPPGLHPTTAIPPGLLMATQVLPSQLANGITKPNDMNGKAFKSKNQQRRARLKAKKAEQKVQPVRRVRSPLYPIQNLSFLALRAGRHAS